MPMMVDAAAACQSGEETAAAATQVEELPETGNFPYQVSGLSLSLSFSFSLFFSLCRRFSH